MQPIFLTAMSTLIAAGLIKQDSFKKGMIEIVDKSLPPDLHTAVESFLSRGTEIKQFIINDLTTIKLFGVDGLKHRTGLMEFRYDHS